MVEIWRKGGSAGFYFGAVGVIWLSLGDSDNALLQGSEKEIIHFMFLVFTQKGEV